MALIKCPECGKQVSERAASCPDCGCPIGNTETLTEQIPVSQEVDILLKLAHRSRAASNFETAKHYYDQILIKDPGNWEAVMGSQLMQIQEENESKKTSVGAIILATLPWLVALAFVIATISIVI